MEKDERCCGNCATFSNEDANGVGWCDKKNKPRSCYQFCKEHKLRQEREVNMKEEYIAQIAKELTEYMDWMTDSLSTEVTDAALDELIEEIGDVLWYCATLSHDLGYKLSDIGKMNYDKLHSRQLRGKLHGNGDNR